MSEQKNSKHSQKSIQEVIREKNANSIKSVELDPKELSEVESTPVTEEPVIEEVVEEENIEDAELSEDNSENTEESDVEQESTISEDTEKSEDTEESEKSDEATSEPSDDSKEKPITVFKKSKKAKVKKVKEERKTIEVEDFQGCSMVNKNQVDLSNIASSIDLSSIKIKDASNPIQLHSNVTTLVKSKPVYQVVATHSGYTAYMSGITIPDMVSLQSSSTDASSTRDMLNKIIYSHVENTSVGKLTYAQWARLTAVEDLPTLMYGIYCITYPDNNEFNITCASCGKKTPVVVNNKSLVTTHDANLALDRVRYILRNCKDFKSLQENSLLNETTRILLPDSKAIIDVKSPSIHEQSELFSSINPDILNNTAYAASLQFFLYIKNLFVLDVFTLKETGEVVYNPVKDVEQRIDVIHNLGKNDGMFLSKKIHREVLDYSVEYVIKNITCKNCEVQIPKIPINIETVLFTQIGKDLKEE